jgi:uncharacterized protein (TIGR03066 family)
MCHKTSLALCLLAIPLALIAGFAVGVKFPGIWPAAAAQQDKTPHSTTPPAWEYRKLVSPEKQLTRDLNKLGADGWELVTTNMVNRFEGPGRAMANDYVLVFKRGLKIDTSSPGDTKSIVGVWQLVGGDKGNLGELTLECGSDQTVTVSGPDKTAKSTGGPDTFTINGTYEVTGDNLIITLRHDGPGGENVTSRDKIKKLTATQLILEDENGKTEEYKRVSGK